MGNKAFLVDSSKCQGCRGCQVACKQWNGLPGEDTTFFGGPELTNPLRLSAITWNHVKFYPLDRSNKMRPVWNIMHRKCFHCNEANCAAVCPEKAIKKVDGWTLIDQSKCIGCGECESKCVYQVPKVSDKAFKNDAGQNIVQAMKSHKCNACSMNERDIPACVNTCLSGSLTYGDRDDLLETAKKRVKELQKEFPNASLYGEKEFGGLNVLTILRDKPEKFDLPTGAKAKKISSAESESIKDGYALFSAFSLGVPTLKRTAFKMARSLFKEDNNA